MIDDILLQQQHVTTSKFIQLALMCIAIASLFGCDRRAPTIDSIQTIGELRVAIELSPHNYFSAGRVQGFQQELIERYAAAIEVKLKPVYVNNRVELMKLVQSRRVHLGVGMIPVTNKPARVEFGPSFGTTDLIVVTRAEAAAIQSRSELAKRSIAVSFEEIVEDPFADDQLELFNVTPIANASTDDLLALVNSGDFDAAVVSKLDFLVLRRKYPELHQRFVLRNSVPLAWLLSQPVDVSLVQSLNAFINALHHDGTLDRRQRYYFDHLKGFDFVEARTFLRNLRERLPKYREYFEKAALEYDFDWRLLAAMSYQESHWDPDARSPTGVRGIMMLTEQTAKELNVSRLDPAQSIDGGARYLATLRERLAETVEGQDRLLLALAAYNVGWGHLQDALRVAKNHSADATNWQSVRKYLPWLARPSVAAKTRYGRARGGQAVHFVDGVRRYFAILRQVAEAAPAAGIRQASPALAPEMLPL